MAKDRPEMQRSHPRRTAQAAPRQKSDRSEQSRAHLNVTTSVKAAASLSELTSIAGFLMDPHRQDALIVEEVGESWLRSRWTFSAKTLERAASAMGRDGHKAIRVLRLLKVEQDDSGPRSKEFFQEIELPSSAEEWFIHVPTTEHAWLIEVGLVFGKGRFFSMLHSVPVTLNGSRATLQGAQRFLGGGSLKDAIDGGEPPPLKVQGTFHLSGITRPGARAHIDDQPVPVDSRTGSFEWKLPLSNGRVVVPINVVNTGKTQRALLAIDLNFHLLEPEPTSER